MEIKVLAVDFLETLRILRSVAAAEVVSHSMKQVWRPSDIIASANVWGEVGMWEAQIPKGPLLRQWIHQRTREIAMKVVDRAYEGPLPLIRYLTSLVNIRDRYLENISTTMASFNEINRSTLNALNASVYLIKAGRFTASIGLIGGAVAAALYGMGGAAYAAYMLPAATNATAAAIAVPTITLTKSISFSVIKTWNAAPEAQMCSIALEVGKAGTNEGMGKVGSHVTHSAGKGGLVLGGMLNAGDPAAEAIVIEAKNKLMRDAAKYDRMRRLKIGGQTTKGIRQRAAQVSAQRGVVEASKRELAEATLRMEGEAAKKAFVQNCGKAIGRGSLVAFTVWDLYDTFAELNE